MQKNGIITRWRKLQHRSLSRRKLWIKSHLTTAKDSPEIYDSTLSTILFSGKSHTIVIIVGVRFSLAADRIPTLSVAGVRFLRYLECYPCFIPQTKPTLHLRKSLFTYDFIK